MTLSPPTFAHSPLAPTVRPPARPQISQLIKSKLFDKRLEMEKRMLEAGDQSLCEDYVEDLISKMEPLPYVCRMLCLLANTVGLNKKKLDHFKREILQTYGFEYLPTLLNLEKLGVLTKAPRRSDWGKLRKSLKLQVEKLDLNNAQDYHFVCSGYAPLSIRVVEMAAQPGGLRRNEEVLQQLPGRAFEYRQELPASLAERASQYPGYDQAQPGSMALEVASAAAAAGGASSAAAAAGGSSSSSSTASSMLSALLSSGSSSSSSSTGAAAAAAAESKDDLGEPARKPVTLVFFIGGVTYAEIAALRWLSEVSRSICLFIPRLNSIFPSLPHSLYRILLCSLPPNSLSSFPLFLPPQREGHGREYVVASTNIINGTTLFEPIAEAFENNLDRKSL